MNKLNVAEVSEALVARLSSIPELKDKVAQLTDGELNGDADIIITDLPAVRIFFRRGTFIEVHGPMALDYTDEQEFVVLCGAQNFSGPANERKDALSLLDTICDRLAGLRISGLPSHDQRPQVVLRDRALLQPPSADYGTWYALVIAVTGITSYEANAAP